MDSIVYLIKNGNMNYFEVLELPYGIFQYLIIKLQEYELNQTPEGRAFLEKRNVLTETQPNLNKLRNSKFYLGGSG